MSRSLPPVARLATLSLVAALGLLIFGKVMEAWSDYPFLGGLLVAFGEAALVGGLADWFAVRALFAHPFGIPFPHTALIPNNRPRIVREIRDMVITEWLPRDALVARVRAFDFVERAILPVLDTAEPHLRTVVHNVARDLLDSVSPGAVADFLGRNLAGAMDSERLGTFLADLCRQAREKGWLEPLVREWGGRLSRWVEAPTSRAVIRGRLEKAAQTYQSGSFLRQLTFTVAEKVGGIDLDAAAAAVQGEIKRFASEVTQNEGKLNTLGQDGLARLEARLRDDPDFLAALRAFLLEPAAADSLRVLLAPMLASLRERIQGELDGGTLPVLDETLSRFRHWRERLRTDPALREQANGWCQRLAGQFLEEHHALIGVLVEEQLNRLTDEMLTDRIEARVGEDLNWIRINGALVGGMVGVFLYLAFRVAGGLGRMF